ncbi:MAG: hypothetical protein WHS46_01920 [Desulfosoma sp.]
MRIETLDPLSALAQETEKPRCKQSEASSFEHVLSQEIAEVEAKDTVQEPHPTQGLFPAEMEIAAGSSQTSSLLLEAVSGTLDQLLAVCSKSSEASANLQTINQLLTNLGQTADEILQSTSFLQDDHPVRRLAQEASVLAYVESIKWRRGDYM